jgi:hypothetical protein
VSSPNQIQKLRGDGQPARVQDNVGAVLDPIAKALSQTPIMGTAPTWTALQVTTGFAATAGFATAAHYKDSLFRVWVKGALTCAAGCAANTTIATMPSGSRPRETQRKSVMGTGGTAQFVSIAPTGVVTNVLLIGAGGTIDIDFSFLAEQ